MFEEQKAQLEQQMSDNQPEATANPEGSPTPEASPEAKQLEAVADLSKFKKILLDGEELSFDDLKKQRMLEKDYRRKTHEFSEERRKFESESRFAVNFPKDMERILQEPWLAAEFYKLYPTEYHGQVKRIEQMYNENPGLWTKEGQEESKPQDLDIDRLVEEKLNQRLRPLEEKEERAQQQAHLASLDALETKLMSKYNRANKYEVYAAAEYLSKPTREYPEGRKLTDKDWEKVYKDSHERTVEMIKKAMSEEFNQQKQVNQRLKDVAPGGGVPGEAPPVARSIREATAMWSKANGG